MKKITEIVLKGGLKLDRPLLTGQWWGNQEGQGYGQDVLILRRADETKSKDLALDKSARKSDSWV